MPGCEGAVSAFYSRYAKEKWNRLAAAWSPKARANCQRLKPYGLFEPLEAQCEYTVMYCQNGYCSVFFDTYVRQGAQELDRGRQSCTFWAPAGMVPLAAFSAPAAPTGPCCCATSGNRSPGNASRSPRPIMWIGLNWFPAGWTKGITTWQTMVLCFIIPAGHWGLPSQVFPLFSCPTALLAAASVPNCSRQLRRGQTKRTVVQ